MVEDVYVLVPIQTALRRAFFSGKPQPTINAIVIPRYEMNRAVSGKSVNVILAIPVRINAERINITIRPIGYGTG